MARKTTISFGLISIPVELHKMEANDSVSLKSLCDCGQAPTNNITCACGKTYGKWWGNVPVKGYEVSKGQYVVIPKEEIEDAEAVIAKYDHMDLEKTVDYKKLSVKHVVKPAFWALPPRDAHGSILKAYRLVVEALAAKGLTILTRLSVNKAKRLALISDVERNLLVVAIVDDAREVPYLPERVEVSEQERNLVEQLLDQTVDESVTFEADINPVAELVKAKVSGESLVTVTLEKKSKPEVSLTDLLKQSIEAVSRA